MSAGTEQLLLLIVLLGFFFVQLPWAKVPFKFRTFFLLSSSALLQKIKNEEGTAHSGCLVLKRL